MTEVERIVTAIMMVETGPDKPMPERYWETGDGGQALGPWQMHPAHFVRWWRPQLGVTWQQAFEDAMVRFVEEGLASMQEPELIAQAHNLGEAAVFKEGKRNPEYAAKFQSYYDRLAPRDNQ